MVRRRLQQISKLLGRHARIARDTAHRERVNGIVPRNGKDPGAIGHYDVLALTSNVESSLFQSTHRIKVINPSNLRQVTPLLRFHVLPRHEADHLLQIGTRGLRLGYYRLLRLRLFLVTSTRVTLEPTHLYLPQNGGLQFGRA